MSVVDGKGSKLFLQKQSGYGYCADRKLAVNGAKEEALGREP
jgi:hypothetical protein